MRPAEIYSKKKYSHNLLVRLRRPCVLVFILSERIKSGAINQGIKFERK